MTTITPLPTATEDVALTDERLAGTLIGLVFAAVVVAFLLGLFLF
jgi:tetrahydromethanopterin S-methyltransferase subunit F